MPSLGRVRLLFVNFHFRESAHMSEHREKKFNRRWTKDDVIREILAVEDRSAKSVQRRFSSLYGAATRHFGSWKAAVEAAGIDYSCVVKRRSSGYWQVERILEAIQRMQKKNSTSARMNHVDLYSAALRTFGSWEKAIRAAGFDYDEVRKGWIAADEGKIRFKRRTE